MAFRKLLEAECSQSNPIEQLSSHVTNQQAQQETIARRPFIYYGPTQDNSMPPQNFSIEDLIDDYQPIETNRDLIPSYPSEKNPEHSTSTSRLLICWNGLCVIDEIRVTDVLLDEPRLFIEFDKAYRHKYCNDKGIPNKNQNFHTAIPNKLMDLEPYKYNENNPMLGDFTALGNGEIAYMNGNFDQAILCFEAAVQRNSNNLYILSKLCKALFKNDEFLEGLCVANQILKMAPNSLWVYSSLSEIYVRKNCRYQVCQYMFNWLRFNTLYADIVPPNFKMEDKTTTELDDDTLNTVKDMFTKAAQRMLYDPELQVCLAKLYHLSGENEKVSDCLQVISCFDPNLLNVQDAKFKIGLSYFFANKPEETLRIWLEVVEMKCKRCEIYRKIGFVYIYLKNYLKAAVYLSESLKERYRNISDMKFKKDFARLALCLELLHKATWQVKEGEEFPASFEDFINSFCETHLS